MHHSPPTYIDERARETLALLSELLQLLDESVRHLARVLDNGIGSGPKSRVDLGSLVDDVLDNGRGVLEQRSDALKKSANRTAYPARETYRIVDGLGLLDDDQVLGRGLERVCTVSWIRGS